MIESESKKELRMSPTCKSVGEIAAETPAAVRVFEKHGIDFCCGGKRQLDDVCREKELSPDELLTEVEAASKGRDYDSSDWTGASLRELIKHIIATHHEYLRMELPVLQSRLAKVADKHRENHPYVIQMKEVFENLKFELDGHLLKEERILFPYIEELEAAQTEGRPPSAPPFGSVDNPVRMMMFEHDSAGVALGELRRLTQGYAVPEDACNTFRAALYELERMELDLHVHIHLENNILFPRAQQLERSLS
jgi:regulator of cell morphogenesis and NO signaling